MYYLVTVNKYHGLNHPEDVSLTKIETDDIINARKMAIKMTVDPKKYYDFKRQFSS